MEDDMVSLISYVDLAYYPARPFLESNRLVRHTMHDCYLGI
jgi:hypothetical protein